MPDFKTMNTQQEKIKKFDLYLSYFFPQTEEDDAYLTEDKGDENEKKAREYISKGKYAEGKEFLVEAIKHDIDRKQRLQDEFGFLYDFDKTIDEDKKNWKNGDNQKKLIDLRRQLWQILSNRNPFKPQKNIKSIIKKISDKMGTSVIKQDELISETSEIIYDGTGKTSEIKGKELEKIIMRLFKRFLVLCEENGDITPIKERHQKGGNQSGHDLKFVYVIKGDKNIRVLIECKNYKNEVGLDDIAGKLLDAEAYNKSCKIDHWILISPRANLSNKLEERLEEWDKDRKYPFKVQAWTPENKISKFFGLIPKIYDIFFKPGDGEIHPKNWDESKRNEVVDFWRRKLEPPIRLPNKWEEYLRSPEKILLPSDPGDLLTLYKQHVKMRCRDNTGELLKQTLEEKILDWLEKPVDRYPSIFLLGEFGDGKTVFTYILCRKLAEGFLSAPSNGWIPIRFSLKDFSLGGISKSRDFVKHRLDEFGADIEGWETLKKSQYRLLVILDGFDEISKKLTRDEILKNINLLIECYRNEFSGIKLLITSRKHFFENQKDKNRLIKRIGNPELLHLSPIDRKTAERHLSEYAREINEESKFSKLRNYHDPIDLASKPLFLEMVKASLKELPEDNLDELILYEIYTRKSLRRKEEFLEDENLETSPEKVIENMIEILEEVALNLHQSKEEFVYLSELQGSIDVKRRLWEISDPDAASTEDPIARVAVRSLLKRVETGNCSPNKKWPVDFCHRSMREYFVARAVCSLVKYRPPQGREFLKKHSLNHEIIFFASKIMKKSSFEYQANLLNLINSTKNLKGKEKLNVGFLGCNAVNLLYQYKGELTGNDWSDLVLNGADLSEADLSGKNFSKTLLQYATLDNVNFINSDFSKCNLTGVRFEEASPVQSLKISTEENIYAAYQDGTIREWFYNRVRKPYSENLLKSKDLNEIKLISSSKRAIIAIENEKLIFYDKIDTQLKQKAVIEIKPNLKLLKVYENFGLLIKVDKQDYLHLINLKTQIIEKSLKIFPFSICENFDDHAFIIYNENTCIRIIDMTSKNREHLKITSGKNVTCLTTCRCQDSSEHYRLGFGQKNGIIQIWEIDLNNWEKKRLFQNQSHKNTVKDIAFIKEDLIISGGFDKILTLLKFDPKNKSHYDSKEFKIDMQCHGMETTGIIREEERLILEKFRKKSSL